MRWLVTLWAAPLLLFWGWYFVSLNDWNFGYVLLTRALHDVLFQLYGELLGVEPAALPGMLAKGCVLDSLLLAGLIAFRKRRAIAARLRERHLRYAGVPLDRRSA